jgi:hypothetical protein
MRNVIFIAFAFLSKLLFYESLGDGLNVVHAAVKATYDFLFDLLLIYKAPSDVELVKGRLSPYVVVLQT